MRVKHSKTTFEKSSPILQSLICDMNHQNIAGLWLFHKLYPRVIKHGNGKYTIYRSFYYWNPNFEWIPCHVWLPEGSQWYMELYYADPRCFCLLRSHWCASAHGTMTAFGAWPQFFSLKRLGVCGIHLVRLKWCDWDWWHAERCVGTFDMIL